jgi:hypothetical protein
MQIKIITYGKLNFFPGLGMAHFIDDDGILGSYNFVPRELGLGSVRTAKLD